MQWLDLHVAEVWFLIIGFFVLYYAVADGIDLGVGVIALFSRQERKREVMMASLQSMWQDNQTWLVVLGGMLFGAFPLFYSVALSALYVPLSVMLVGLIFRGIAFEIRLHARESPLWSLSFGFGSLVTTLAQGFTLGSIFYGIPMAGYEFTGTIWSWFHPYSFLFALGVLSGYVMLGANYLLLKTEEELQAESRAQSLSASVPTLGISVAIYLWTIVRHPYIAQKWTTWPSLLQVALFPAFAAFAYFLYLRALRQGAELLPLLWNAVMVFSAFIGISVGFYPFIIPNLMTIRNAAASSPNTLVFMLAVIVILLPVILSYIAYKQWIFRGKVEAGRYGE